MMSDLPTAEYVYNDPRYGWISIQANGRKSLDLVIQTNEGNYGFTFEDGEFKPHCICSAYHEGECCCMTGQWGKEPQ